jgi:hypothetical protein
MSHETEIIRGVPQIVCKLPIQGPPPADLAGLDIPHMLDRIIIGPTQYPWPMYEAFVMALTDAGIPDAGSRLVVSDIPIRA